MLGAPFFLLLSRKSSAFFSKNGELFGENREVLVRGLRLPAACWLLFAQLTAVVCDARRAEKKTPISRSREMGEGDAKLLLLIEDVVAVRFSLGLR